MLEAQFGIVMRGDGGMRRGEVTEHLADLATTQLRGILIRLLITSGRVVHTPFARKDYEMSAKICVSGCVYLRAKHIFSRTKFRSARDT